MTPRERVYNRLKGEKVDKIPNLNILMSFAAKEIGVTYKEFSTDYRKMVDANIICCDKYGIDMVNSMTDPAREAFDMGANVVFPEDSVPYISGSLIKDWEDLNNLQLVDPFKGERMLDRINAIHLYKEKIGGKYPILGWAEGAFASAANLRGINEFMMDLLLDEEFCFALLDKTYAQCLAFVEAQIAVGADFIGIGDAVASLIGPELFVKYALPYEKKIAEVIHKAGLKLKLHICGNIEKLLPYIKEVQPDILDLDWPVDMKLAVETFKGTNTCISGNLNPVADFEQKKEEEFRKMVVKCYENSDNKTFISSGCEVPRETPCENLIAMKDELSKLSKLS